MKTLHIVAILLAAMLIPLAAAEDAETTDAYIVTPASNDSKPHIAPLTYGTITQGETDWYSLYVPPDKDNLWVDLDWGTPSNSLNLTIYPPDGTVLGPYHDADDGKDNGRIFLCISKNDGLPSGIWYFEVYGEHVQGIEDYSFVAYY
ncbi:MAG: peptidase domain-containing protein [Euryarchaeota archaeon]|nr:peptidase domain-containing protein [Euryarchaeota archaeon]